MFRDHDAVDLFRFKLIAQRCGLGSEDNGGNRLAEVAAEPLSKNEQFERDGFESGVLMLRNDEDHYSTLASFLSFSTRAAAASSAVPPSISTLLFFSGMKISFTSYIAPAFPTTSAARPRSP